MRCPLVAAPKASVDISAGSVSEHLTVDDTFFPQICAVLVETVFVKHVVGTPAHIILQARDDGFVLREAWLGRGDDAVVAAVLVALRAVVYATHEI